MAVPTCKTSTQEVWVGESKVQVHPWLSSKFEASLQATEKEGGEEEKEEGGRENGKRRRKKRGKGREEEEAKEEEEGEKGGRWGIKVSPQRQSHFAYCQHNQAKLGTVLPQPVGPDYMTH